MTRLAFAIAITFISSAAAFADEEKNCNPAVQNWENGSQTTCPIVDRNNNNNERQRQITSVPVSEQDV